MTFLGKWFIGFGLFLIACGVAGYASNPEEAKTALISGSAFGGMAVVVGALLVLGQRWAWWAGLGLTLLLLPAFAWRSTVGWQATMAGEDKLFAASLITLMLIGTIVTLGQLILRRKEKS